MHIVVVGADHSTAPIALRERLACSSRSIPQVLSTARLFAQEAVLLSTCNRTELYAVCIDAAQGYNDLLRVLSETRQVTIDELSAHCYVLCDEQAVRHLFGVACGLYSLVPGEPQIQGQVVEALELAQGGGYAGPLLSALFRSAVQVGKRARSETGISRNAVSVSHVAVQLARHLFPRLEEASVLLIGSGQMSELAARNLRDNGAQRLVIVNRTYTHAVDLAQLLGASHRTFAELSQALVEADVVISSTIAPVAVITGEMMQEVMRLRAGRSLLVIDIAMPRDVEPTVNEISGVHLYNLDDLQAEVERGLQLRRQEAALVQAIIAQEVQEFERWQASLSVVGTISDLRQRADELRERELARTMRQLAPTLSERERAAVQELTTRLMNKLLHTPTMRLKEAAADGQGHVYAEAMRYLFNLEEDHEEADIIRHTREQARDDTDSMGSFTAAQVVAQSCGGD